MSEMETGRRRGCPRWLWALLGVSLALNLVAGGMMAGRHMRRAEATDIGRFNARLLDYLPEENREAARTILTRDAEERRALRRDLLEASATALARFAATPLDAEALGVALLRRSEVLARRQALRDARVTALAAALPAEARAEFADRLAPRISRRLRSLKDRGD